MSEFKTKINVNTTTRNFVLDMRSISLTFLQNVLVWVVAHKDPCDGRAYSLNVFIFLQLNWHGYSVDWFFVFGSPLFVSFITFRFRCGCVCTADRFWNPLTSLLRLKRVYSPLLVDPFDLSCFPTFHAG